jgi:hypothetical protein
MTGTPFVPIMVAVIIVVKIKKLIQRFIDTGTTSPPAAKTPEELNIRTSFLFQRLMRRKVLVETYANRFYLDEEALQEYNNTRRKIMFIVILIIVLLVFFDYLYLRY